MLLSFMQVHSSDIPASAVPVPTFAETGPALTVVTCAAQAGSWAACATSKLPALVFLRAGALERHSGGAAVVIDPCFAFLLWEGAAEQVRHLGHGHSTTVLSVTSAWLADRGVVKHDRLLPLCFATGPDTDLLHRRLAAGELQGRVPTTDELRLLVELSTRDLLRARRPRRGDATEALHRAVVNAALQTLVTVHSSNRLTELAAVIGVSPHHLSRQFHAETGLTLRQHRSRFRVRLALNRLAMGCGDLSAVAYELGFADHAHFTRTVRQQLGFTPTALRAALSSASATTPPRLC